MKILFHPSFDKGYYGNRNEGTDTLGTKVVGMAGLLDHLSLHNGLSGRFPSDGERAAAYLTSLEQCAEGSWIEKSFKNDRLGVAKCLLGWRDSLIMAGWTPDKCGTEDTPKLQLLTRIEGFWQARLKGTSDRWLELARRSQSQSLLREDDHIICTCAKEQLPLLVQKVLEACGTEFATYPEEVRIPEDLKVKVLHYKDLLDVYRQVASGKLNDGVLINRDNVSLNHTLFAWGKPLVDATIQDSNPLSLQLFKLALAVFSRPLNIQNLLSYFQLPVGPIPRRLRTALANVLVSDGGFGEIDWDDEELTPDKARKLRESNVSTKWGKAIWEYVEDEEGLSNLSRVKRESKLSFLSPVTSTTLTPGEKIPRQVLMDYIGSIDQWAAQFAHGEKNEGDEDEGQDEVLKSQLGTVISYFKQLQETLEGRDGITYEELEKTINTIYQPTSIIQAKAQVKSLQVIDGYEQLLDTPETLTWLDCCGAEVMADRYDFLSVQERAWLNEQPGICVPRLQDMLDLNRKEMITILSKVQGGITLVTADYHHNQKMAEHPFLAELKMQRGEQLDFQDGSTDLPLVEGRPILKVEPKLEYDLGPISYAGRSESNTSIDTLINYPFDYTVHYIAGLGEPSKKELGSIKRVTGLVAHLFIQNLINDVKDLSGHDCLKEISRLVETEFGARLDKAVQSTGLALLLKENEVEYNNLPFLLERSVKTLVKIMEHERLTPVGCELKYNEPVFSDESEFNARIDMELKDEQENSVIFDFKWSYSSYYGKKIENRTAVQLELYRQELLKKGKKVKAVGYYLLPKCVLETSDFDTYEDAATNAVIIHHIDPFSNADLFKQIQESVFERRKEIREGHIEEGEMMDIKDLSYSKALLKGVDLLPVGTVKKDRKSKANPDPPVKSIDKDSQMVFVTKPESRFQKQLPEFESKISPQEKPTTYPLMKGRLK